MSPRVIILAGAPTPMAVTASSCTMTDGGAVFDDLLAHDRGQNEAESAVYCSSGGASHAAWRSIPLESVSLFAAFSQTHQLHQDAIWGNSNFYSTVLASSSGGPASCGDAKADDALTQFCEESLVALNSISSPVLKSAAQATSDESSSFTTAASADQTSLASHADPPVPLHLSDLEDVPPASHVLSVVPQTITINLVVGIMSIAQPRTVTTRWRQTLSLVEVLVGDDTASGFAVTFWLDGCGLSPAVERLRRQDVVLMQNVALHVFRGKVYGQSLRKGLTKLDILWRGDGTGYYSSKCLSKDPSSGHPQRRKVALVMNWVLKFVGPPPGACKGKKTWLDPPDDTQ